MSPPPLGPLPAEERSRTKHLLEMIRARDSYHTSCWRGTCLIFHQHKDRCLPAEIYFMIHSTREKSIVARAEREIIGERVPDVVMASKGRLYLRGNAQRRESGSEFFFPMAECDLALLGLPTRQVQAQRAGLAGLSETARAAVREHWRTKATSCPGYRISAHLEVPPLE